MSVTLLDIPGARELIGSALVAGRLAGSRFCITNFMDPDLCDVDAAAAVLAGHGVPLLSGPADRPWASARPCSPMPAVACGNSSRTPPSRIKDLAQRQANAAAPSTGERCPTRY
jgi:hypothetical protein